MSTTPSALEPQSRITETSSKSLPEKERSLLLETARRISPRQVRIVSSAPKTEDAAIPYFQNILRSYCTEKGNTPYADAATAVFALYRLSPWGVFSTTLFDSWCLEQQFRNDERRFALALIKELQQWEPATPEDYARVLSSDRALVRSARVAATKMDKELFFKWLAETHEELPLGFALFARVRLLMKTVLSADASQSERSVSSKRLEFIAQRILLSVGNINGREGLNAVRRAIGSPPKSRRKPVMVPGAASTERVRHLAELYKHLRANEREGLKRHIWAIDQHFHTQ